MLLVFGCRLLQVRVGKCCMCCLLWLKCQVLWIDSIWLRVFCIISVELVRCVGVIILYLQQNNVLLRFFGIIFLWLQMKYRQWLSLSRLQLLLVSIVVWLVCRCSCLLWQCMMWFQIVFWLFCGRGKGMLVVVFCMLLLLVISLVWLVLVWVVLYRCCGRDVLWWVGKICRWQFGLVCSKVWVFGVSSVWQVVMLWLLRIRCG